MAVKFSSFIHFFFLKFYLKGMVRFNFGKITLSSELVQPIRGSSIGLPISFGRPMVFDSLFQKMSQNLPLYLQMYPPSLPKMKLNRVPHLKPLSLPKMKLPIGCPIQIPLKHEYYRFLIPMFLRLEGNVPPPPQE